MFDLFRKSSRVAVPPLPCMNCGHTGAVYTGERTQPDFNLNLLPPTLRTVFENKLNGICFSCGFFQAFNRPDAEQIKRVNEIGKDPTTSWDGMKTYPVEQKYIDEFENAHVVKRIRQWDAYFDRNKVEIKNALFIRAWFGASAAYVQKKFSATVAGLDMSEACVRTAHDRVPGFNRLDGTINHAFSGPFLTSGPYDAVFIFHTLTHSCDVRAALNQLKNLLSPGGFLLLTHETVKKPTNPFHMAHMGELQLVSLLRDFFDRVDRIDDCGTPGAPHITSYTLKRDEPDFVAWRRLG